MALTCSDLLRAWFAEVWDKGRAEAMDDYVSADWVSHGIELPGPDDSTPLARFRLLYQAYRSAFPDISISVDQIFENGDFAAAHCTARGTHTGEGLGFDPTGRAVEFTGVAMVRCADGKIAESWESWNFLTMYQQLGLKLGQP